jgi:hypothetical protein
MPLNFLKLYFINFFIIGKKSMRLISKKFKVEFRIFFLSYANYLLRIYQLSRTLAVKSRYFYCFAKHRSGRYFIRLHDWRNFFSVKRNDYKFVSLFFLKMPKKKL